MCISNYSFLATLNTFIFLGPGPQERIWYYRDVRHLTIFQLNFLIKFSCCSDLFFSLTFNCFKGWVGLVDVEAISSGFDFCSSRPFLVGRGIPRGWFGVTSSSSANATNKIHLKNERHLSVSQKRWHELFCLSAGFEALMLNGGHSLMLVDPRSTEHQIRGTNIYDMKTSSCSRGTYS